MKKTKWIIPALIMIVAAACQKANDISSQVSLTASTTQAVVGQTVSVQLSADKVASSWSVTPSTSVAKTYSITTSKVNYFTFGQPGVYVVGVRARDIAYDSTHHQNLDSCWYHGGGDRGNCTRGKDSASVVIKVI